MAKPSKPRNNLVELFRFIYSLLVMGFHVQLYHYPEDEIDAFECGAVSVEFSLFYPDFFCLVL